MKFHSLRSCFLPLHLWVRLSDHCNRCWC